MILIPILTVLWAVTVLRAEYRSNGPDSYDLWLQEPDDTHLEIVE